MTSEDLERLMPSQSDIEESERPRTPGFWTMNRVFVAFLLFMVLYYVGAASYEASLRATYLNVAIAYYNRGDYKDAESGIDTYLAHLGSSSSAHYYLGMCFIHDGRTHDAIDQFYQDTTGTPMRNREVSHVNHRSWIMIKKLE